MKNYWEGTVKHYVTDENGKLKKANSVYLVDAVNHTEVEALLTEKMSYIVNGDFNIKPIRQSDITKVISDDPCGKYWKLKFEYELDKKITETRLIEANSIKEAIDSFVNHEAIFMHDFEVISVTRSKVLDVYEYSPIEGDFEPDEKESGLEDVEFDPQEFDRMNEHYGKLEGGTYSVTNTDEAP